MVSGTRIGVGAAATFAAIGLFAGAGSVAAAMAPNHAATANLSGSTVTAKIKAGNAALDCDTSVGPMSSRADAQTVVDWINAEKPAPAPVAEFQRVVAAVVAQQQNTPLAAGELKTITLNLPTPVAAQYIVVTACTPAGTEDDQYATLSVVPGNNGGSGSLDGLLGGLGGFGSS